MEGNPDFHSKQLKNHHQISTTRCYRETTRLPLAVGTDSARAVLWPRLEAGRGSSVCLLAAVRRPCSDSGDEDAHSRPTARPRQAVRSVPSSYSAYEFTILAIYAFLAKSKIKYDGMNIDLVTSQVQQYLFCSTSCEVAFRMPSLDCPPAFGCQVNGHGIPQGTDFKSCLQTEGEHSYQGENVLVVTH